MILEVVVGAGALYVYNYLRDGVQIEKVRRLRHQWKSLEMKLENEIIKTRNARETLIAREKSLAKAQAEVEQKLANLNATDREDEA